MDEYYIKSVITFIESFTELCSMSADSIHIDDLCNKPKYTFMDKTRWTPEELIKDIQDIITIAVNHIYSKNINVSLRLIIFLEEMDTMITPLNWLSVCQIISTTPPELCIFRPSLPSLFYIDMIEASFFRVNYFTFENSMSKGINCFHCTVKSLIDQKKGDISRENMIILEWVNGNHAN